MLRAGLPRSRAVEEQPSSASRKSDVRCHADGKTEDTWVWIKRAIVEPKHLQVPVEFWFMLFKKKNIQTWLVPGVWLLV